MINNTCEKLKGLRLPSMVAEYRRQTELPATHILSFDDRLSMIVDAECLARYNKRLKDLIRLARLREPAACLEDLDYNPMRALDKTLVARLSDGAWIKEGRNVIITGSCGTGKTYLASAFGNAACRLGLKVRSYRVTRLLTDLYIGRGDGSYNRILSDLKKPDLLILDDFGIAPIDLSAARDFLEVIDDRHSSKATLITAQLPVSGWHGIFEDPTVADAILDRLVNNSYRFKLDGPSMRVKEVKTSENDS